jgi:hypothetical protein
MKRYNHKNPGSITDIRIRKKGGADTGKESVNG